MQENGIHYYESFSPTISQTTLCIVMVLTMETIPGFSLSKDKSQCLRLLHTLYGLVQSPLPFYRLCKEVYTGVDYRQMTSDEK